MRGADVYYGAKARDYEATRSCKAKWDQEHAGVGVFLVDGPVLDVPFGTGRFVPIYRGKGLEFVGIEKSADMLGIALSRYPDADARLGSIFEMSFPEQSFGTVVCVRFLEWFPVEVAADLICGLRRIGKSLIVTVNHGEEGEPEAFTYDFGKFLSAIDGLFIAGRRVTARIPGITSEMFKLRPANWHDVEAQFPDGGIQRIADKHAGILGVEPMPIDGRRVCVRAEYWTGEQLGRLLARLPNEFHTTDAPRRNDGPLTILDRGDVRTILDGRHRANRWQHEIGPHPVLLLRA